MKNMYLIVVVLVVLAGGFYLFNNSQKSAPTEPAASSTNSDLMTSPTVAPVKETAVNLTQSGFEPKSVTVKVGEKVVWTNNSGDAATVDSSKHPAHLDYPPMNLGRFEAGGKLEHVFTEAGTFKYHDHLHPQRFGSVTVE